MSCSPFQYGIKCCCIWSKAAEQEILNIYLNLFGPTANSVPLTCRVLSPTWVTLIPPYSWGRSSSLTLRFSWLSGRCFWRCLNTKNTITTAMISTPMGTSTAITMYMLIGNSSSTVKSKLGLKINYQCWKINNTF